MVTINYRQIPAHRYGFKLAKGSIMPGMLIRHTCDNPPCQNPAHLLEGTHVDSMRDMDSRGRRVVVVPRLAGEDHPHARLTWQNVDAIRASNETCAALGPRYGVSAVMISRIKRGISWTCQ